MSKHFQRSVAVAIACAVYLGFSSPAMGWGDTGHQVVALRAWRLLSPSERHWAVELLKHHPRYDKEFAKAVPPGASDEERMLWAFEYGAIWPDYIWPVRATEPAFFAKYQHSSWHSINEPLFLDATNPPAIPTPHPATNASTFSIKEALPNAIRQLTNKNLSAEDRAVALCWVIHLVGDLHQPCHSTTLFSRRFTGPEGDHVATKLSVETPTGQNATMHHLWDDGLGTTNDLSTLTRIVQELEKDPVLQSSQLNELRDGSTVTSWIAESHDCAVRYVYTPEVRAAIAEQEAAPKAKFKPVPLSESYLATMRQVCQRRGALAGYRLAKIIHESAPDFR